VTQGNSGKRSAQRGEAERSSGWYERPERGSMLGIEVTAFLYRVLGRRVARLVLYGIVAYFLATDAAGRRASRTYFARVARASHTLLPPGRVAALRRLFLHYLEFGTQILDRVGLWIGRPQDFAIEIAGAEHLERVAREGKGALVLGSHVGSFDIMRLAADLRSPITVNVMMYTRHAARINQLLARAARRSGAALRARVLEIEPGSFLHAQALKQRVDAGEVVALLADRVHPNERARIASVDFLGEPAPFPQGPWLLASALGCPVLLMTALRAGERKYRVHVEWLADRIQLPRAGRAESVALWCRRYAALLERHVVAAPYQWFNFYPFWEKEDPLVGS
jgi:predicted LPLAT superfamily acyltransferase